MPHAPAPPPRSASDIAGRLVESLYTEAMLLADETRAYFDSKVSAERAALSPHERVLLACEALKGTTRLMQVLAWLLTRKAIGAGDLADSATSGPHRRLGEAPAYAAIAGLPREAERLLIASGDLYDRVSRLDRGMEQAPPAASPARSLLERLERSL